MIKAFYWRNYGHKLRSTLSASKGTILFVSFKRLETNIRYRKVPGEYLNSGGSIVEPEQVGGSGALEPVTVRR